MKVVFSFCFPKMKVVPPLFPKTVPELGKHYYFDNIPGVPRVHVDAYFVDGLLAGLQPCHKHTTSFVAVIARYSGGGHTGQIDGDPAGSHIQ